MATIATKQNIGSLTSLFAPVWRVLAGIGKFMILIGDANRHVREIRELEALSDRQLADIGLKRGEIARHVMRNAYQL